jgi:hypothetical protein
LIVAGHETTVSAVIWSLVLLASAPQWRQRVKDQIDGVGENGSFGDLADRLIEPRAVLEEANCSIARIVPILSGESPRLCQLCDQRGGNCQRDNADRYKERAEQDGEHHDRDKAENEHDRGE